MRSTYPMLVPPTALTGPQQNFDSFLPHLCSSSTNYSAIPAAAATAEIQRTQPFIHLQQTPNYPQSGILPRFTGLLQQSFISSDTLPQQQAQTRFPLTPSMPICV
ncbi:unnamed protein product [Protopolystoma xenopodis]|uniref:Uncharacterized protein n=1 Tax=Protopolystoma xenopodis TaxID=117903 RepID=A0A3S5A4C4_9PLAT|nr:unnamed protein product [Protopolystoma xenopodis]